VVMCMVFSERERNAIACPYVRYMLSPVRLSSVVCLSVCLSVYRLSVTFVTPLSRLTFSVMFLRHLVPAGHPFIDMHGKFYRDHPRGTPPSRV